MSVIATDSARLSAVLKAEFEPNQRYCRAAAVINDAAGTIAVGTAMGQVTATGKWKVALSAASDGSQVVKGIYIANGMGESSPLTVAANTDTNALLLVRGPAIVSAAGLVLGTGITAAAAKTALEALNPPVLVEQAV